MDAVNITVNMVKIAKNRKNPRLKNITSPIPLFNSEWLTNIGKMGRTQGEIKDAIPAKNERKKPVSTLYTIKFDLKVEPDPDILQFFSFPGHRHLKLLKLAGYTLYIWNWGLDFDPRLS